MHSAHEQILRALGLTLLLLGGLMTFNPAHAGITSVELDHVPLDINVDCSRFFFRSRDGSMKTVYVTPFVFAGKSPYDGDGVKPGVHVQPIKGKDTYKLTIEVRFPRNPQESVGVFDIREVQESYCNFETVINDLNKLVSDEDEKVQRVAHIPLTSIEVSLPNLDVKPYIIGEIIDRDDGTKKSVDLLDYIDKSYSAVFEVTADQLDEINEAIQRYEGMQLDVLYRFQSISKNGDLKVTVNKEKISSNIQTKVQGKAKIAKGSLEGVLRDSILNSGLDIRLETSSDEQFNDQARKIISQITDGLEFETLEDASGDDVYGDFKPSELKGLQVVQVDALLERVSTKVSNEINLRQYDTDDDTTAETTTRFRHPYLNPYLVEMELRDGPSSLGYPEQIRAGESITISPFQFYGVRREWKETSRYLTLNELDDNGVYESFMLAGNAKMSIKNKEIGGRYFAQGLWWEFYFVPGIAPDFYRWIKTKRYPIRVSRLRIRRYKPTSLEYLRWTGIQVTFPAISAAEPLYLDELIGDFPEFRGEFKNGSVVLTAKMNIGKPIFNETFPRDYYKMTKFNSRALVLPYTEQIKYTADINDIDGDGDTDEEIIENVVGTGCKLGNSAYLPSYMSDDGDGNMVEVQPEHPEDAPDKDPGCRYRYSHRYTIKNLEEVRQERHFGWGWGGSFERTHAAPVPGKVDNYAIDMYWVANIIVSRPTVLDEQPSDDEIHELKVNHADFYGVGRE